MVKLAYNDAYDTAILVSSDGDFVPAVKSVQDLGKIVINAYFQNDDRKGYHLRKNSDKFIEINEKNFPNCLTKNETQGGF